MTVIGLGGCDNSQNKEEGNLKIEIHQKEANVESSQNFCGVFTGTSRYKLLKHAHGFTDFYGLRINCNSDSLTVDFLGPSPEGEHGMYYFYSHSNYVQLSDSIKFNIELEKGNLYKDSLTFTSINNLENMKAYGFDKTQLSLEVTYISKDSILVKCRGQNEFDCYSGEEVFTRVHGTN